MIFVRRSELGFDQPRCVGVQRVLQCSSQSWQTHLLHTFSPLDQLASCPQRGKYKARGGEGVKEGGRGSAPVICGYLHARNLHLLGLKILIMDDCM